MKTTVFEMQPRYYIVRIYRLSDGDLPEVLVGAVEDTNGRRWSFRTPEELLRILSMNSERSPDANETSS